MAYTNQIITVNQIVSEDSRQIVVRGAITIPDAKPDVEQVISTDKTAKIKSTKLLPDKVVVEGKLTVQVVYVAFEPPQSVHHFHGQIPFTGFVDLPGALPGMDLQTDVLVEDLKVTPSSKDTRVFDVTVVLQLMGKVTEPQEVEVLTITDDDSDTDDNAQADDNTQDNDNTQDDNDTQAKYETIHINDVVARGTSQVIVSAEFDEPLEKPEPETILDVDSTVTITETRLVTDKVIVDGELSLQILYVGAVPRQTVHEQRQTIKFTDFVDVEGADPDMDVNVKARVEDCEVQIKGDPYFEANCVIKLDAMVTEPREVLVVVNCPDQSMETVELNVEELIGEDSTQVVAKGTFETPEQKPCPLEIVNVSVENIAATDVKVIKDKVIVRGQADLKFVYVSDKKDRAVHAMHHQLDFRSFVEIPGALEGMDVDVRPVVEYITGEPVNCDVRVDAVIKVGVRVTQSTKVEVCVGEVSDVTDEAECTPGEIIDYTIKSGDTLYDLAQRYSTTVNQILRHNPGIKAGSLTVGQVIRIPCGAKG
ncbi:MAG: DUF3794 domain-containing protein [Firmicutes bacterium]|nr:DUF3794 domain-containing protein [Bacillota bacterium]